MLSWNNMEHAPSDQCCACGDLSNNRSSSKLVVGTSKLYNSSKNFLESVKLILKKPAVRDLHIVLLLQPRRRNQSWADCSWSCPHDRRMENHGKLFRTPVAACGPFAPGSDMSKLSTIKMQDQVRMVDAVNFRSLLEIQGTSWPNIVCALRLCAPFAFQILKSYLKNPFWDFLVDLFLPLFMFEGGLHVAPKVGSLVLSDASSQATLVRSAGKTLEDDAPVQS